MSDAPTRPPATTFDDDATVSGPKPRFPLALSQVATRAVTVHAPRDVAAPARRAAIPGTATAPDRAPSAMPSRPTTPVSPIARAALSATVRGGADATVPNAPQAARRPLLRPQQWVAQAAQDAAVQRRAPRADSDPVEWRRRMVQRLAAQGLGSAAVHAAMREVPRHRFVDGALRAQAYEDTSLPIGLGQTISKPSVVARMLALAADGEWARANGTLGRVLEVGTGCGYQTALLVLLARHVVSVERLKALFDKAQTNLAQPGLPSLRDVRLVHGDGMRGHPPNAPFHTIVAAAGGDAIPDAWVEQLAPGGRIVAPMAARGGAGQVLVVVDVGANGVRRSEHEAVTFVPLKSGVA